MLNESSWRDFEATDSFVRVSIHRLLSENLVFREYSALAAVRVFSRFQDQVELGVILDYFGRFSRFETVKII